MSVRPDGAPWSGDDAEPSISADGTRVLFESADPVAPALVVRDLRTAGAAALPGTRANGTLSGDGCVVAGSVLEAAGGPGATWRLGVRDLCAGVDLVVDAPALGDAPAAAPAVSLDGGVVVWSVGGDLLAFRRDGAGYVAGPALPRTGPVGTDAVIGDRVDVSADGSVVVLTATDPAGTPQVVAWQRPSTDPLDAGTVTLVSRTAAGDPGDAASTSPSISADGRLVAFVTEATDLADGGAAPAVVVGDLTTGELRRAAADAAAPDLSLDGRQLVVTRGAELWAVAAGAAAPFASPVEQRLLDLTPAGSTRPLDAPVVSSDGRVVAFAGDAGAALTPDTRFHAGVHVWAVDRAVVQVSDVDLGEAVVGSAVDASVTVTNAGAVPVTVGAATTAAPFAVVSTTCTAALAPGGTCTVVVRATPTVAGEVTGVLAVADPAGLAAPATGELRVRGTTASGGPTTTAPPTTTPPTSLPIATVPPSPPTTGSWRPPTYVPPRPPSRPPSRPVTRPTATTTPTATAGLRFDPSPLVLADAVAGTGRVSGSLTLSNVGRATTSVVAIDLDPATTPGFTLDGSACLGVVLAPGSSCTVDVVFAPTDEGQATALVVAEASTGGGATGQVSALGVPPPVLAVDPGVAAPDQVATVVGSGFPAGEVLTLHWGTDVTTTSVTADATGSFRLPLVVMRHVGVGPMRVVVDGAPDRYPPTEATLIVGGSGDRPNATVVRGTGGAVGG